MMTQSCSLLPSPTLHFCLSVIKPKKVNVYKYVSAYTYEFLTFTNKLFERGKKSQKSGFDDIPAQISRAIPTIFRYLIRISALHDAIPELQTFPIRRLADYQRATARGRGNDTKEKSPP